MTLILKAAPISLNKLLRMHHGPRARLRRALAEELMVVAIGQGATLGTSGKKTALIHYYLPRRFDKDNAYGGAKLLIDAMRDVGLIVQDSPKWFEWEVCQHLSPQRYIVVEIHGQGEGARCT